MNDQTKHINFILSRDMSVIMREILDNSRSFVQNLIKSLKLKKQQPFSAYKVDLSLFHLKQVYERIFPQKKHGGQLLVKNNKTNFKSSRDDTDQVTEFVTFKNGVSLLDRSLIINLLEGVKTQGRIPNFVQIISVRSSLSRGTIQNRIRVGRYLIESESSTNIALKYRKGLLKHSQVLNEI